MTHQLDLPQCPISDDAFRRIEASLPKAREVRRRVLPPMFPVADATTDESTFDVGRDGASEEAR